MEYSEQYGHEDAHPRNALNERLAAFWRVDILRVDGPYSYTISRCPRASDGTWLVRLDMHIIRDPRWYDRLGE